MGQPDYTMDHQYIRLKVKKVFKSNKICCVPQCINRAGDGVSLHLPSSQKMREIWENVFKIGPLTKTAAVCSDHFTPQDYIISKMSEVKRRRLKPYAVPSLKLPLLPEGVILPTGDTETPILHPKRSWSKRFHSILNKVASPSNKLEDDRSDDLENDGATKNDERSDRKSAALTLLLLKKKDITAKNSNRISEELLPTISVKPFDPSISSWNEFLKILNHKLALYNVPKRKKSLYLLEAISRNSYNKLSDLCKPNDPKSKSFEDLSNILSSFLQIDSIEEVNRSTSRLQKKGETVKEFATELKKINCNISQGFEKILLHQFVNGLQFNDLKDELLKQTNLNFDLAVQLACEFEKTRSLMKQIPFNNKMEIKTFSKNKSRYSQKADKKITTRSKRRSVKSAISLRNSEVLTAKNNVYVSRTSRIRCVPKRFEQYTIYGKGN